MLVTVLSIKWETQVWILNIYYFLLVTVAMFYKVIHPKHWLSTKPLTLEGIPGKAPVITHHNLSINNKHIILLYVCFCSKTLHFTFCANSLTLGGNSTVTMLRQSFSIHMALKWSTSQLPVPSEKPQRALESWDRVTGNTLAVKGHGIKMTAEQAGLTLCVMGDSKPVLFCDTSTPDSAGIQASSASLGDRQQQAAAFVNIESTNSEEDCVTQTVSALPI